MFQQNRECMYLLLVHQQQLIQNTQHNTIPLSLKLLDYAAQKENTSHLLLHRFLMHKVGQAGSYLSLHSKFKTN